MGISRGCKFPSGLKADGLMSGTIALQYAAFSIGPMTGLRSRFGAKMNASAALSLSSTHESPAPAAQLATGWASNPGPGWYGGFHGRPGLGTGSERM